MSRSWSKSLSRNPGMCSEPKHRLFSSWQLHYDNVDMETVLWQACVWMFVCELCRNVWNVNTKNKTKNNKKYAEGLNDSIRLKQAPGSHCGQTHWILSANADQTKGFSWQFTAESLRNSYFWVFISSLRTGPWYKWHFSRFFKTQCLYYCGFKDAFRFQYEVVQKGITLQTGLTFVTKLFMELKTDVYVTRMTQKKSAICLIILYFYLHLYI